MTHKSTKPSLMQKICVQCGQDVATKKRVKTPQGDYYCGECYAQRVAAINPDQSESLGDQPLTSQDQAAGFAAGASSRQPISQGGIAEVNETKRSQTKSRWTIVGSVIGIVIPMILGLLGILPLFAPKPSADMPSPVHSVTVDPAETARQQEKQARTDRLTKAVSTWLSKDNDHISFLPLGVEDFGPNRYLVKGVAKTITMSSKKEVVRLNSLFTHDIDGSLKLDKGRIEELRQQGYSESSSGLGMVKEGPQTATATTRPIFAVVESTQALNGRDDLLLDQLMLDKQPTPSNTDDVERGRIAMSAFVKSVKDGHPRHLMRDFSGFNDTNLRYIEDFDILYVETTVDSLSIHARIKLNFAPDGSAPAYSWWTCLIDFEQQTDGSMLASYFNWQLPAEAG